MTYINHVCSPPIIISSKKPKNIPKSNISHRKTEHHKKKNHQESFSDYTILSFKISDCLFVILNNISLLSLFGSIFASSILLNLFFLFQLLKIRRRVSEKDLAHTHQVRIIYRPNVSGISNHKPGIFGGFFSHHDDMMKLSL